MGWQWWIGLGAGALIGFFVSIGANLLTLPFFQILVKGRAGIIERNKAYALRQFNFVNELRAGKRDKHLYFSQQWGTIIFLAIISSVTVIVAMFARLISSEKTIFFFGVWAVFMFVYCGVRVWRLDISMWRLDNFSDYEIAFKKKWER